MPSFDTLTYAKKLQEAGFTPRQAEAQAEALRGVLEENIATQQHLKDTEDSLKRDIKELEVRLTQQIELIRKDMEVMRRDIIIWLGGLIVVSITALGILMKLL